MDFNWLDFLTVIMIAFAIVMVLAGLFTTYFGTGKGRAIGLILLAAGIVVGAVWIWLAGYSDIKPFCDIAVWDVFWRALVDVIGVAIGGLIAVGFFLLGIMKS